MGVAVGVENGELDAVDRLGDDVLGRGFDFRLQLLAELLGDVGREVAAVLEEEISDEFAFVLIRLIVRL